MCVARGMIKFDREYEYFIGRKQDICAVWEYFEVKRVLRLGWVISPWLFDIFFDRSGE